MRMSHWALLVGGLAIAGCGGRSDRTEATRDTGGMMGRMDSGGMGMAHMDSGGMEMGNMQGMTMMSGMRAHMDSMMRMSPQQMQAMMARHQQMMSSMMDGMGADMRNMKMSGTPEWSALTDSVKQDLADLPNLKGQQLSARMRAHNDRVKRLIAMHEKMMAK
ncbi:MAG TPA: hypothetical protein VGR09_16010 [Gemmatimonadales bacterium]|nr:hypothetical protein [Gemmatimonadales bacterium]